MHQGHIQGGRDALFFENQYGHDSKRYPKKIGESPRVIDRGTSAHFCVSDQYLISKVLRIK